MRISAWTTCPTPLAIRRRFPRFREDFHSFSHVVSNIAILAFGTTACEVLVCLWIWLRTADQGQSEQLLHRADEGDVTQIFDFSPKLKDVRSRTPDFSGAERSGSRYHEPIGIFQPVEPVMNNESFASLIERVRSGDQDAAALLVEQYAPVLQRAVRFRLTDPRLRTLFDSMDICQSTLGSFFVRAAAGQYEVNSAKDLMSLLTTMARNKLVTHARRERARLAVVRRSETQTDSLSAVVSSEPDPAGITSTRELCQNAIALLTAEERDLLELRRQGQSWIDISRIRQNSPVVLRKQLSRALDRVLQQVGLE